MIWKLEAPKSASFPLFPGPFSYHDLILTLVNFFNSQHAIRIVHWWLQERELVYKRGNATRESNVIYRQKDQVIGCNYVNPTLPFAFYSRQQICQATSVDASEYLKILILLPLQFLEGLSDEDLSLEKTVPQSRGCSSPLLLYFLFRQLEGTPTLAALRCLTEEARGQSLL